MGSLAHVLVHQRPLVKEVRECLNDGVMLSIFEAREDSEVHFREQGAYRTNSEYTYNGWRKIDVLLKFIIEPCANAIV